MTAIETAYLDAHVAAYPIEYIAGIDLYNAGEFHAAHDAWEERWMGEVGPKDKFARLGVNVFMSLDLDEYQSQLDLALSWLLTGDPRELQQPQITPPKIRLLATIDDFD